MAFSTRCRVIVRKSSVMVAHGNASRKSVSRARIGEIRENGNRKSRSSSHGTEGKRERLVTCSPAARTISRRTRRNCHGRCSWLVALALVTSALSAFPRRAIPPGSSVYTLFAALATDSCLTKATRTWVTTPSTKFPRQRLLWSDGIAVILFKISGANSNTSRIRPIHALRPEIFVIGAWREIKSVSTHAG